MIYIESLYLKNFGPHEELNINFSTDNINAITGKNASGKTQIIGAILYSILGNSTVNFNNDSVLEAIVKLNISDGKNTQSINSKIKNQNFKLTDYQEIQPDEFQFQSVFKNYLKSSKKISLLLDPYSSYNSFTLDELKELKKFLENINETGFWKEYSSIINESSILPKATKNVVKILYECIQRNRTSEKIPLIIDGFFGMMDDRNLNLVYKALSKLSQENQVILTTVHYIPEVFTSSINFIKIEPNWFNKINPVNFNYNFIRKPFFPVKNKKKENLYRLGDKFSVDENINFEFKEVKGRNPISSIKSIADQYVVAYLNSVNDEAGYIIWGVQDVTKKIVGLECNNKERDEIRRTLSERLLEIKPEIAPSAFSIKFHEIYSENKELYLLEVVVPPIRSDYLYSTAKGEVYIKTDGGKKKLTTMQIQKEFEKRIIKSR